MAYKTLVIVPALVLALCTNGNTRPQMSREPGKPVRVAQCGWATRCYAIVNNSTYIAVSASDAKSCHEIITSCVGSQVATTFVTPPVMQPCNATITQCR